MFREIRTAPNMFKGCGESIAGLVERTEKHAAKAQAPSKHSLGPVASEENSPKERVAEIPWDQLAQDSRVTSATCAAGRGFVPTFIFLLTPPLKHCHARTYVLFPSSSVCFSDQPKEPPEFPPFFLLPLLFFLLLCSCTEFFFQGENKKDSPLKETNASWTPPN